MCTVERFEYCYTSGTLILSFPSPIHQNIKDKIVASTEHDTIHIFRTLHNTSRVFKNKVSVEVVETERRPGGAKFEDIKHLVSGERGRKVYEIGDPEYGIWSAGVTVGLINDIPTCKELIDRLERGVGEIASDMARFAHIQEQNPSAKL